MRLRRGSEKLERLMDGSHRNLSGSCAKSSFQPSSGEAGVKEGKAVEGKNRCMQKHWLILTFKPSYSKEACNFRACLQLLHLIRYLFLVLNARAVPEFWIMSVHCIVSTFSDFIVLLHYFILLFESDELLH